MREEIIAGLDIGSTEVRLVVGQRGGARLEQENSSDVQIIGAVSVPSRGISKGVVKSIEDVTSAISACLDKTEKLVGVPIDHVWVSMNSPHIKCEKSRGVVAISRSDGEISHEDVDRALEAARALSVPPNYEILHVIPVKFTVDNQDDIRDPVGMIGVRLEVETLIVQGLSSQIKNLTKAIFRTGLDIDDLVLSPLAAAEAVISSKQKDLGSALVNIGAATTSLAVFEEGELLHTAVIPIGSEHISADIAIGLRCPISLAEKIKLTYGSADPDKFDKKEEIDVSALAEEEGIVGELDVISARYLAQIIEARVEEIFEKIDDSYFQNELIKSIFKMDKIKITSVQTSYTRQEPISLDMFLKDDDEISNTKGVIKKKYTSKSGVNTKYLPAIESFGDGVFFEFDYKKLKNWLNSNPPVNKRINTIIENHPESD